MMKLETDVEVWESLPEFPNYEISNFGYIRNSETGRIMKTSNNGFGHIKITLVSERTGKRLTRSVAQMVAEAFVEPPTLLCDSVVVLDGNFDHVSADNLVWRPHWYAYRYTRQLKMAQPLHFRNLRVKNLMTGTEYSSIVVCGMTEGLLFEDIWRSTWSGDRIFPFRDIYEISEKGV